MAENLYALFRRHFAAHLAAPFLETLDGRLLTYAELDRASARYVRLLRGLGLRKGDHVVAQLEKCPEGLFLYFACLRGGFVFVPVSADAASGEFARYGRNAEPAAAVCMPGREREVAELLGLRRNVLSLGPDGQGSLAIDSRSLAPDDGIAPVTDHDLAVLIYTSGTTGRPKGVMLSHRQIGNKARVLRRLLGWRADDVSVHALPTSNAHGLFLAMNGVLLSGAKLLFLPRFEVETVIGALERATAFTGVPTMYARLLAHPRLGRLPHMRLALSSSAQLPEAVRRAFRERTGHDIVECYGMTEAGTLTTTPLFGERPAGSVGRQLPGVELRLVDDRGHPVTSGVGRLEARSEDLFEGYWRAPREEWGFTADGFFMTGDLARIDEGGNLHIVGRTKDIIVSGGHNIHPREVELEIERLEGVRECAVIGVPHPDLGEGVLAVVVPRPGSRLTGEALAAALASNLARHKVPRRIVFIDALPRNAVGKVRSGALRQTYADAFASGDAGGKGANSLPPSGGRDK